MQLRRPFLWLAVLMSVRCGLADWPPFLTCDNGPQVVRSATVSTRRVRAYAITESHTGTKWGCANIARLYVAAAGRPFQVVYTLTPLDATDSGDSLLPIAWSHDGRWLAIEGLYTTQLPNDSASLGLLLYDARTKRTKEVNSDFSAPVSAITHRQCDITLFGVIGFNASDDVTIDIGDTVDEEGLSHACVGRESRWLLDPETGRLRARSGRR